MFSPLLKGETQVCLLSHCSFHFCRHLIKRVQWSREYAHLPREPVEIAHKNTVPGCIYFPPRNLQVTLQLQELAITLFLKALFLCCTPLCFQTSPSRSRCPNAAANSHIIWELPEDLVVSS